MQATFDPKKLAFACRIVSQRYRHHIISFIIIMLFNETPEQCPSNTVLALWDNDNAAVVELVYCWMVYYIKFKLNSHFYT